MSRRKKDSLRELVDMAVAEDAAIKQLATYPASVAASAAVKAAVEMMSLWELEMSDLLRRDQHPEVWLSAARDRRMLYEQAAKYSVDPLWYQCPASEVHQQLVELTPDAAAFVACKVARSAVKHAERQLAPPTANVQNGLS